MRREPPVIAVLLRTFQRVRQHALLDRSAVRVYSINLTLVEPVSLFSFTDLSATGADAATQTTFTFVRTAKSPRLTLLSFEQLNHLDSLYSRSNS